MLVLRLSSVGDIVLTEPVLAALRECLPDAEIGFATRTRYADLVASHPAVHHLHLLGDSSDAMSALSREIRDGGYTTVVDLHANIRTARLSRAAGAGRVLRYVKRSRADAVRVRFLRRPFRASTPLVRRYLDAVAPLRVSSSSLAPRLYVSDSDRASATDLLAGAGMSDRPFAAVVPGSVWATKRWPAERFAGVAERLAGERGLGIALLGSEGERGLCETVGAAAGADVWNAAGATSLGAMAAVIARASVFVGNDSGPTHMAKALGVPTVAVFGPTDPGQFLWEGHRLLYRDLECSACSFYGGRKCHLGHWNCMLEIDTGDVASAVLSLLDEQHRTQEGGR